MILKFTPKGGYRDASKSILSDKSNGCAQDHDRVGSPPSAGPSCPQEQDNGSRTPFVSGSEANEIPIVAKDMDEATAAMDTCCNSDSGPGMKEARHELAEQRVRKNNKVTKDKSRATVPEISMTLVHGDCVVLYGDDFEVSVTPLLSVQPDMTNLLRLVVPNSPHRDHYLSVWTILFIHCLTLINL